jgi:uncharacterized protein (TIGR02145 family)
MTQNERDLISAKVAGLMIYCTNCVPNAELQFYNGSSWVSMSGGNSVPAAPTIGAATRGDSQATVAFSAPVNNGSSSITSYTVFSNPQERIATGTESPITITGLTKGTNYNFKVAATNATGTGLASSLSNTILVATSPNAPAITGVTPGDGRAVVSFTAPADNGGATITSYTATSSPGGFTGTVSQAGGGTITVNGLINGTSYNFKVTATNAIGTSVASTASGYVRYAVPTSGPLIYFVAPGNGKAVVSFRVPDYSGLPYITSYTATSVPEGITGTSFIWPGVGEIGTINVSGLTNGTAYRFRVTATNSVGTSFGDLNYPWAVIPSPCAGLNNFVTDTEGNSYPVVEIGGKQCWMASNLRVTKYSDGEVIPFDGSGGTTGEEPEQTWGARTSGARTVYGHDIRNLTSYGYLYNWYAAKGINLDYSAGFGYKKNICPTGWHVPSDDDWTNLIQFIDPSAPDKISFISETAGGKMKSTSTLWTLNGQPAPGTDNYGFNALPSGIRKGEGAFGGIVEIAVFWSSSEGIDNKVQYQELNGKDYLERSSTDLKSTGQSIRCLRDVE